MRHHPRTCPACQQRWTTRAARFCGSCGTLLDDLDTDGTTPRRRGAIRPMLTIAALALLVAAVATAGLEPLAAGSSELVEVPDAADSSTRLTEAEERTLLAQVDPGRLRCEPRGCERWRRPLPPVAATDGDGNRHGDTVLVLDEVVVTAERAGDDDAADDVVVVAYAITSGNRVWEQPVRGEHGGGVATLQPGPDAGVLVVTGRTVVALTIAGDERWRWPLAEIHTSVDDVEEAATTDGTTLLRGWNPSGPQGRYYLAALDAETGQARWILHGDHTAVIDDGGAFVARSDRLRRVDPVTADTVWEQRGALGRESHLEVTGRWLHPTGDFAPFWLVDRETGDAAGHVPGVLARGLVEVEDRVVGIVSELAWPHNLSTDRRGQQTLVMVEPDGSIGWQRTLGVDEQWTWSCCWVDADGTQVEAIGTGSRARFDLATGAPVEAHLDGAPRTAGSALDLLVAERVGAVEMRWLDAGTVHVTAPSGEVRVFSEGEITVLSTDPLVVADEGQMLAIDPMPPADRTPAPAD